jgi:hypothetical protein
VESLQNDGVFRLKLISAIGQQTTAIKELNKTVSDFAETLFEKLDAMIVPETSEEEPEVEEPLPKAKPQKQIIEDDSDSDFELPPLNLSKKK